MSKYLHNIRIELERATTVGYINIRGLDADGEEVITKFALEPMELAYLAQQLGALAITFPEVARAVHSARGDSSPVEQGPINEVRGGNSEAEQDDSESGVQRVPEGDSGSTEPSERPAEEVREGDSCGDERPSEC